MLKYATSDLIDISNSSTIIEGSPFQKAFGLGSAGTVAWGHRPPPIIKVGGRLSPNNCHRRIFKKYVRAIMFYNSTNYNKSRAAKC